MAKKNSFPKKEPYSAIFQLIFIKVISLVEMMMPYITHRFNFFFQIKVLKYMKKLG